MVFENISGANFKCVWAHSRQAITVGGVADRAGGSPALPLVEKRRRLLAVIRENFDQIHAEMREFKPTEWIALKGHPEEVDQLHRASEVGKEKRGGIAQGNRR